MAKRFAVSTKKEFVAAVGDRWIITDRETGRAVAYCEGRIAARERAAELEFAATESVVAAGRERARELDERDLDETGFAVLDEVTEFEHMVDAQEIALNGGEVADIDEWVDGATVIAQTRHVDLDDTVTAESTIASVDAPTVDDVVTAIAPRIVSVTPNGTPVVSFFTQVDEVDDDAPKPARAKKERVVTGPIGASVKVSKSMHPLTGTTIRKGSALNFGLDATDGAYITQCDEHESTAHHANIRAMRHASKNPGEWCDQCRAIVSN